MNVMALFSNKNIGDTEGIEHELQKLSFSELNALQQMAINISKGNYHRDYITFYKNVIEAIRLHLDGRIQNKLFRNFPEY